MKTLELNKQGEKFIFLKTALDTNGERVEAEFTLSPGAYGPRPHIHTHIHTKQVEWLGVISGRMTTTVDKKEH